MPCMDICDDKPQIEHVKAVKLEARHAMNITDQASHYKAYLTDWQRSKTISTRRESNENRDSNATVQINTRVVDQGQSQIDDTSLSPTSSICPAPLCRQFWKVGNYDGDIRSKPSIQSGKNYMHIHPKFLHSNATSHRWIFGGIAELIDNSIDEVENGATFVLIDTLKNPRDGSQAFLIQDDGGGMNPEAIRCCISFGFSDKNLKSAIGQYGNGFKTSTMRLGADVIVFTRCLNNSTLTQSIGLLSYTFLSRTDSDRIVVPLVDYKFNTSSGTLEPLLKHDIDHYNTNLALILQWSPYSTEAELLKQFDDIGYHGTKIIVYNLWLNDEGNMELDFDSDPEDIHISGEMKKSRVANVGHSNNEQHITNKFHYSLRIYLSILYLRIPQNFRIILRGKDVEYHNIADDLKELDYILYKPHNGGCLEGKVITTIGFLKEAPHINFSGFNVYHKNRLIMPFWQVLRTTNSRGRGVVGVLEANFIQPTHNKQDFERTSLFQKLETRLKEMNLEYWDVYCGNIGYKPMKKVRQLEPIEGFLRPNLHTDIHQPVILNQSSPAVGNMKAGRTIEIPQATRIGVQMKRTQHDHLIEPQYVKRLAGKNMQSLDVDNTADSQVNNPQTTAAMQKNKNLQSQCVEYQNEEKALNLKVLRLQSELEDVQRKHVHLLDELKSLDDLRDLKCK